MKILVGDMFKSTASTLVNTVNCVGVMGKGIAETFKKSYPDMYKDYRRRCECGLVKPGEPYLFSDLLGTSIINFPTKDHWRSSSRLSYIDKGLDWFAANWEELGLTSVAFPPLGCGNGGLAWEDVGPLMYRKLAGIPIDIEIYAPYGTPERQLSPDFLSLPTSSNEKVGNQWKRYNQKWDLILYVIQSLNMDQYSLSVGRTIYQKICYILTRSGVETGFVFTKGDFGPYSSQAKNALTAIANKNLINEDTLGSMIRISVSPNFELKTELFSETELSAAEKTIDLFSRVRNTEQAETSTTLIFGYDELAKTFGASSSQMEPVAENEILDYVTEWKPRWANAEKRRNLASDLFYLSALEWINATSLTYEPGLN